MSFDNVAQASLLYDFYGQLLTKRQQEVLELYHEENLSLSEIADEFNISRQGVHETLKNAEKALQNYEDKLGLVGKFQKSRQAVARIDEEIDAAISGLASENRSSILAERLQNIKTIIDKLDQ